MLRFNGTHADPRGIEGRKRSAPQKRIRHARPPKRTLTRAHIARRKRSVYGAAIGDQGRDDVDEVVAFGEDRGAGVGVQGVACYWAEVVVL